MYQSVKLSRSKNSFGENTIDKRAFEELSGQNICNITIDMTRP